MHSLHTSNAIYYLYLALVEVGVAVPLQIHPEFNQWIDALHLAEQHIVEDGMLSDFEFHIHIVDTQMDEAIAMEGVLHAVAEENLSGFFGGLLLDETLPMQYILKSSHVPQIAPIEASPQMANRELHPYFMTPTVSGVDEARALLALLENYGWMYFAAVHSQFADGVLPTETIMNLAGSASYTGPKIVSRSTFDLTQPATIRVALQSIVDSGTRVVYFPGRTDEIQQVFAVAAELNMFEAGSWVWIVGNRITLSELWATQSNIPGGVLGIGIYTGEGPTYDRMVSDLRTRFNSSTEHPHSLSATGKLTPGTALMYDSVMTVLMGKYNLQQKNASLLGDGASLLRSYDTVSFQGATGQVRYSAGQRIGGIVSFINKVGTSWIPFASVKINSTAAESLSLQISSSPVFLGGSSTVPKDRFLQYVDWENGAGIVIVAVACLIMLGVLVTLIVVIRLRLNPLIRASSPAFLIVVLVGTFMALASIFPSTGIPTVAGCTTRVWLFVYGFVLAYGAILIKNWRIWRLWTEDSFRIIRISNLHLMGYSLIFVAPFSLLLIVWTVVAIPSPVIRGASIVCDQPSIVWPVLEFVAMGLMLVAGVIFSFLTRNLPQLFNECKYIALATYNMTFSLAVGVALSLVLQNTSVLASYLCYAIGVIFAFGGLWLIIFAPKLFWITFRPEKVAGLSSGTSHSNPTASSVYSPSTSSSPTIHGGSASAVLRSRRSSGKASQGSSERRRSQRGGKSSAELSTVVSVSNREEAHEVPPAPKAGKQQRRLEDQVQEEHVIDMEKPPQIENKKKKRVEDDVDKTKPDETTDRGKSKTKSAQENK
jgi:ABC-type branched-subunit amino acid transport system substrate-binding protein